MAKQTKRFKDSTVKINIRLWKKDIEFAEANCHLFPGMSYHSVLREMVTNGRKVMEATLTKPPTPSETTNEEGTADSPSRKPVLKG